MVTYQGPLDLTELARLVSTEYGIDFSKYRQSCLHRRVIHRMSMAGFDDIELYASYLAGHPDEMERLMDVVTIHVTDFFRDIDVFDTFSNRPLSMILEKNLAAGHDSIRVWSAGCATGEEAYSFGIILMHLLEKRKVDMRVEVFGTDISEESCRIARRGVYSWRKLDKVPPQIKARYFEPDGPEFKVVPEIMNRVKFRVHDLFLDPPYSMLDLIVCRNVLIHFNHDVRSQVISRFYDALGDGGILILGKSEAVPQQSAACFKLIESRSKIYMKKD